jgi:hypothetical protein
VPIELVNGRLPSDALGLHLERSGQKLKLWDPARGSWLLTPRERAEAAEAENERLRREIEAIRRGLADPKQR